MTRTSCQDPAAGNTPPGRHTATQLTARQLAVLRLTASGRSQKQIARHLGISVRTVQGHFHDMRQRTGARSQSELIAFAADAGLLAPGNPPPSKPGGRAGPPVSQAWEQPTGNRLWREPATIADPAAGSAAAARDETRDETQPVRSGTRDETQPGTSRCRVCRTPLAPARTGRRRHYCSRACQARAYRTRQQAAS